MQVFLQVREGSSSRDVAVVDPDRLFTVGRGEQNDLVFAGDPQMSSRHLSIQLQGEVCIIHDLNSTNGTTVNGRRISSAKVAHGDVLRCGTTELIFDFSDADRGLPPRPLPQRSAVDPRNIDTVLAMEELDLTVPFEQRSREGFLSDDRSTERPPAAAARPPHPVPAASVSVPPPVAATPPQMAPPQTISRAPEPAPQSVAVAAAPVADSPEEPRHRKSDITQTRGFSGETATEIVSRFRLQQALPLTPEDRETPEHYLQRLQPVQDGIPALKFLAYALPKRCGVWWLVKCVRSIDELYDGEAELLQLTEAWVSDPTDINRRSAMEATEGADMSRPASWPGMAAYHSDGSTTPPSAPAVPAKDNVTGQSIFAGVTLATLQGSAAAVAARRILFTELGLRIAMGELPWKDGTPH
ncbi:MAG: FHA domain-containing protein [Planctomycetaceae bacterium]